MFHKNLFSFLLFLFTCLTCYAQNKFASVDFSTVDSLAMSVKYENDIYKLAKDLTGQYSEDIYKVRSVFRWITDNIKYDYKFINKGKEVKVPDCDNSIDCRQKFKDWEENYLKSVIKRKKAICDGYSRLFKKLCDICNIKCEMINGYARQQPYEIGMSFRENHSWNAVLIDSTWYYLDATWAAGGVIEDENTGKLLKFIKGYSNYYWLTPFDRLVRNHFPTNGKWIEKPNFTKEKFVNQPHYYGTKMLEGISNESKPAMDIIEAKKGDTINFKFDFADEINKLQINTNFFKNPSLWITEERKRGRLVRIRDTSADRRQVYIPFTRTGNTYQFNYLVTEQSVYYLELLFDYKKAMRYRIKVAE